ncbi:MAG: hypothetical protein MJZ12_05360 [Prevotella sp.]|nr:hypothetical protein [Prevotella sp.]
MKKVYFAIISLVVLISSCQTKQSAINDLRSISQDIAINGDNYSFNDWTKVGKKYYEVNKKIAKHTGDYSDQELQEISKLNGQCVKGFTEGAVTKVGGAMQMLKSFIGGFLK